MRWLFVGIVALNVLYFGWSLGFRDEASSDFRASTAEGVGTRDFPASVELLAERQGMVAGGELPVVARLPVLPGCPAVGPFSAKDAADIVSKALVARGMKAGVVNLDRGSRPLYWVHLPPQGGRPQALRKLRELQAKGIDSFIVSSGPDQNAISLGSFSSRDSAQGVEARLRSSGYEVSVREQVRNVQQIWVVLEDPAAQGVMEAVPRQYQAGLELDRVGCRASR